MVVYIYIFSLFILVQVVVGFPSFADEINWCCHIVGADFEVVKDTYNTLSNNFCRPDQERLAYPIRGFVQHMKNNFSKRREYLQNYETFSIRELRS